jgi:hypothetical protein
VQAVAQLGAVSGLRIDGEHLIEDLWDGVADFTNARAFPWLAKRFGATA